MGLSFQNCCIIFAGTKTWKKTKFWNFVRKWQPYPISYQMLKNPWTNFLKRDQNIFLQTYNNWIKNENLRLVLVQIATTIRHCYKVRPSQFFILMIIIMRVAKARSMCSILMLVLWSLWRNQIFCKKNNLPFVK